MRTLRPASGPVSPARCFRLLAVALVAAVTACTKPAPEPEPLPIPPVPPPQAATVKHRPKLAAHPAATPLTPETPATMGPEATPAETAAPPPPPAAAPVPATLVGLSQSAVRALLGTPAASQESGPGRTWTYRAADCTLTVAFFYDVTRDGFFALSTRADPPPEPACLAHLLDSTHAS